MPGAPENRLVGGCSTAGSAPGAPHALRRTMHCDVQLMCVRLEPVPHVPWHFTSSKATRKTEPSTPSGRNWRTRRSSTSDRSAPRSRTASATPDGGPTGQSCGRKRTTAPRPSPRSETPCSMTTFGRSRSNPWPKETAGHASGTFRACSRTWQMSCRLEGHVPTRSGSPPRCRACWSRRSAPRDSARRRSRRSERTSDR